MNAQGIVICTRCVMDTTDPEITFDSYGVCNHCNNFDRVTSKLWFPNEEGKRKIEILFNKLKEEGKGKEYDCILGLSGGLDSSYLALIMKDYGLRPLVVHVDAGWNSDDSVKNVQAVVNHCNFKLHTKVVNWNEVKDLQLAYLKAGVANQDVAQDHAFFASLYHFAIEKDIKYVISGHNFATESILPSAWQHAAMDEINLKDIHKKYGSIRLKEYKTISFFDYYFNYPLIKKMKVVQPLNYMAYSKEIALNRLKDIGYVPYERKHGESRFTKFFQNYYLPKKFNIDKRKAHLSSLIVSGFITRDEALDKLREPLYDDSELIQDKDFISNKLGISISELDKYVEGPNRHYSEFKNWDKKHSFFKQTKNTLKKTIGKFIPIKF